MIYVPLLYYELIILCLIFKVRQLMPYKCSFPLYLERSIFGGVGRPLRAMAGWEGYVVPRKYSPEKISIQIISYFGEHWIGRTAQRECSLLIMF